MKVALWLTLTALKQHKESGNSVLDVVFLNFNFSGNAL